jgi:putative ABC transport system permease protein
MILAQLTWIALLSIRTRLGSSLVTVFGTTALVVVLLFFVVITNGLNKTLVSAGRPDRAIILRSGAESEAASRFERNTLDTVSSAVGIKVTANVGPIASAELVRDIRLGNGEKSQVLTIRGTDSVGVILRPEIRIESGRMFRPGHFELIVGRIAQQNASGRLAIGKGIFIGNSSWEVVGVFGSNRDAHESEALADLGTLLSVYRTSLVSSVVVSLTTPETFEMFKGDLTSRPNISVDVHRESEYYRAAAEKSSALISVVSSFVCSLMALGCIFAAAHSMYSAVSARTRELATLRAIGFPDAAILGSVILETVMLGTLGALGGTALMWIAFRDRLITIQGADDWSSVVFAFSIDARAVLISVILTTVVCVLGAVVPALGVLRTAVATALRSS